MVLNRQGRIVIILILLIITASLISFAADKAWMFVPASRFGSFSIGQDYEGIEQALGKPDTVKEVQDAFLVKFETRGIIVQYHNFSQKVHFIGACTRGYKDISYRTEEGISIGSTKAQVEQHYSTPTKLIPISTKDFYPRSEQLALYADKGIAFHYDAKGQVVVILVFDPVLFGY